MNETGQRWLAAAEAYSPETTSRGEIERKTRLEEEQKREKERIKEFHHNLNKFQESEEFLAALALLKASDRVIFLGELKETLLSQESTPKIYQYVLCSEGFERRDGDKSEKIKPLWMDDVAKAFLRWKGTDTVPSNFIYQELNQIAEAAPRPVVTT